MTAQEGFGLFGKVPSKGDFVTENLPAEFVQPWDGWMQHTLIHARERMGEAWQACFLSNPVWRFVTGPGVCGPRRWTGVIASSVDAVGRIYPLTLAGAAGAGVDLAGLHQSWRHGFEALTDLALHMLKSRAAFDHAAGHLPTLGDSYPFLPGTAHATVPSMPMLPGQSVRVPLDEPALSDGLARAGAGFSMMWLEGWGVTPFALIGAGLPNPAGNLTLWESAGVKPPA